ncbi:helix-turn-helix domain-containing protein [Streptomyces sp. NPDC058646]|uniref:helix-turn-helix domain-containing protein n=1 Tax=Streptomyces sp. NPDC058646 TaxID=3346574 RepID=UPI00365BFF16
MRYADGGGLTAAGRRRREAVRMQAAGLFRQKLKPPEVARRLRVSRKSVYQWHQMWRDGGVQALASSGPSSHLSHALGDQASLGSKPSQDGRAVCHSASLSARTRVQATSSQSRSLQQLSRQPLQDPPRTRAHPARSRPGAAA